LSRSMPTLLPVSAPLVGHSLGGLVALEPFDPYLLAARDALLPQVNVEPRTRPAR
jgi:hypothetical protein